MGDAELCEMGLSVRTADTPRYTVTSPRSILHFNDTTHGRAVERPSRDGGSTPWPQAKPGRHLIYIGGELSRLGGIPYILQNQDVALQAYGLHLAEHGLDARRAEVY